MKRLLTILMLIPYGLFGQDSLFVKTLGGDDFKEIQQYREMKIVSASRTGKKLEELPFTVYVITKEEIQKNGYITLIDALKMVPSIRTSKPGSGARGETFLMRGLVGNEYAKILINDIPIQTAVSGSVNIGENLPIAQAERIEIIFGPNSAVYGADAMVGVINIITKSPENTNLAQAQLLTGNDGYRHLDFMVGGKFGKDKNVFQYNFYANYGKRDNWNIKKDQDVWNVFNNFGEVFSIPPHKRAAYYTLSEDSLKRLIKESMPYYQGSSSKPTINDLPHQSSLMGFNIKYKNFHVSYNEMYRKDHSSLGKTPLVYGYAHPDTYIAETVRRTNIGYNRSFEKFSIIANASYLRYRMDKQSSLATNYSNGGRSYIYSASDDIFGELLTSWRITEKIELTAGVSGTYAATLPTTNESESPFNESDYVPFGVNQPNLPFDNFGYNPRNIWNVGGFIQMYASFKKLSFIVGYRADQPSHYNGTKYYRLATIYQFTPRFSLRAMTGYAFKAPNPEILYTSLVFKSHSHSNLLSYQSIPNPDLKPEEYSSIELGLRYKISAKLDLDIDLFANAVEHRLGRYQRFIDLEEYPLSVVNENGRPPFVRIFENDENSKAFLVGIQTTLRGRNLIEKIHLNSDLHINLSGGEETVPVSGFTINEFRQIPRWLIQWRVSVQPFKNLYVNIEQIALGNWINAFVPGFLPNPITTNGYYNLDVSGRYQMGKNASAFFKVTNVFDSEYGGIDATGADIDLKYNPQLARNFQVGVSFMID